MTRHPKNSAEAFRSFAAGVLRNIGVPDDLVGSKNSAELEVVRSIAAVAGWVSTFQLKIDNVWLRKLRELTPRLSARSACSILRILSHRIKSPIRRRIVRLR
jgi:hypothetical protein